LSFQRSLTRIVALVIRDEERRGVHHLDLSAQTACRGTRSL